MNSTTPSAPLPAPTTNKPYSAYTIYFRLERMRILQTSGHPPPPSYNPSHHDPVDMHRPLKYQHVLLSPFWYSSEARMIDEKKRKHRKTPGAMSKVRLTELISQSWKTETPEVIAYCKSLTQAGILRRKAFEQCIAGLASSTKDAATARAVGLMSTLHYSSYNAPGAPLMHPALAFNQLTAPGSEQTIMNLSVRPDPPSGSVWKAETGLLNHNVHMNRKSNGGLLAANKQTNIPGARPFYSQKYSENSQPFSGKMHTLESRSGLVDTERMKKPLKTDASLKAKAAQFPGRGNEMFANETKAARTASHPNGIFERSDEEVAVADVLMSMAVTSKTAIDDTKGETTTHGIVMDRSRLDAINDSIKKLKYECFQEDTDMSRISATFDTAGQSATLFDIQGSSSRSTYRNKQGIFSTVHLASIESTKKASKTPQDDSP